MMKEQDALPFGDTRAHGDRLHALVKRLDNNATLWSWAIDDGPAADEMRNILSRALLLVGNEEVRFADGDLGGDDAKVSGFVLLVTDTRLIRGIFRNVRYERGAATSDSAVEAVPLSSVVRVSAEVVQQGRTELAPWPRAAQVRLFLDRPLTGVDQMDIPQKVSSSDQAIAVAQLAARLPML